MRHPREAPHPSPCRRRRPNTGKAGRGNSEEMICARHLHRPGGWFRSEELSTETARTQGRNQFSNAKPIERFVLRHRSQRRNEPGLAIRNGDGRKGDAGQVGTRSGGVACCGGQSRAPGGPSGTCSVVIHSTPSKRKFSPMVQIICRNLFCGEENGSRRGCPGLSPTP